MNNQSIWVFHGIHGKFSSGVFSSAEKATDWIKKHQLTGLLTEYPLDTGVYDWAIENKLFEIKKASQRESSFIESFTSATQVHFHFEDGEINT